MLYARVGMRISTYKTLLAEHSLGEAHLTLAGGERWHPRQERDQRRADARAELEELGLLRGDHLDEDFLDTVHVLQRPATEYYTWLHTGGKPMTVRAARTGREAVLAIANRTMLYLYPARADSAPRDLATRLPEAEPADVHSLSCAEADYRALVNGQPLPPGGSASDAKLIQPWLRAPRLNVGQLFAGIRSGDTALVADTNPPTWIDTEHGRLLVSVRDGWITLTGAGPAEIAAKLTELEAGLRGR